MLDDSPATFKLLACGSQFTANGTEDSWAAYRAARDRLFDQLVAKHIEGVVLLSGDVHRAELRRIPRRAAGGYDLYELTSSPLANSNFDCRPDPSPTKDLIACHDDGNFFIRIEADTTLGGKPAIIPSISGRAWISGKRTEMLDPSDPWPQGYKLSDTWPRIGK